jgi:hypothetical protein
VLPAMRPSKVMHMQLVLAMITAAYFRGLGCFTVCAALSFTGDTAHCCCLRRATSQVVAALSDAGWM